MTEVFKTEAGKKIVLDAYRVLLNMWPVEKKEHFVDTAYGKTFVVECGPVDAPPLILLHGSVSNSFSWMGEVETLTRTHRVFAVDLIGEPGFSDPSRRSYESGAYPLWLAEVFGAFDLDKVSLVGLSLGGWMALSFATACPERVSHLSLLCPGGVVSVDPTFLYKALFYMLLGDWGRAQIFKMINGGKLPDTEKMDKAFRITSLMNQHFRPRTAKLPNYTDEELARLSMPVQVIFGEKDSLIPPRASIKRLQSLVPDLEVHLLPGVGHVVVGQADKISAFLNAAS